MLQSHQQPRLAAEPLLEFRVIGQMGCNELERYESVSSRVMGAVDRGHSAAAYLFKDLVGPELDSGEAGHVKVSLACRRAGSWV